MPLVTHLETEEKRRGATREHFEDAIRTRAPQEARWFKNEKIWLAWINALTWPYMSKMTVRKAFEYVDTELARFFQASVSGNPPIDVNPVSEDDVPRAPKVKNLLLWQQEVGMEDFNDEWERFILNGLIYGFSPCTMDWVHRYGYVPQRVPYRIKGGTKSGVMYDSRLQAVYKGPEFRAVDPYGIYPCPGTIRLRESAYLFHRLLVPYDDLLQLQKDKNTGIKNVEKLKKKDDAFVTEDFTKRVNDLVGRTTGLEWVDYDRKRDVEIAYMWVPGENYYNITGGGGEVMLYEGPIPYWNAEMPYEFWTNFLFPWHWCGLSTPELIEDQQHEIMFLKNARADNRNKQLMPMFLRLRNAQIRKEDLVWRPFGVVDCINTSGLEQLKVNDTWSQSTLMEEQKCDAEAENTVGLAGVRYGPQPSPRESATSYSKRDEASGMRISHRMQRLLNCYKRVIRKQHRYNQQFLRTAVMVRVLGEEINGYTKATPEDVLGQYDFVITPSFAYGNRGLRREEIKELVGLLAAIPGWQRVLQHAPLLERVLEQWDFRDARQYVDKSQEAQRLAQLAPPGGTPAGVGQESPQSTLGNV